MGNNNLTKMQLSPVMIIDQAATKRIKAWNIIFQNAGTLSCTINGGWTLAPGSVLNLGHDNPGYIIEDNFSFVFAAGAGTKRIEILEINPVLQLHNQ